MGISVPLRARDLSNHMKQHELQRRRTLESLVACAADVPAELELADFQWLHEREEELYVPPWRQTEAPPAACGLTLEPTVNTHFPESVPDSCPASPIYAGEIPDSDPDVLV